MHPFSPPGRAAALAALEEGTFDLLVVGGGITGAGLARDAALRGLSVALVEKEDFGSGTSSRSSKLVHGGIRYLAYGDVGLVRESARERRVLQSIAPHLVHRLPFLYPIYQGQSLTVARAGFFVFDRLAGSSGGPDAHEVLEGDAVRARVPFLRGQVKGGILYPEYITDDARLTLENALSAALAGARVVNHAAMTGLLRHGGRVLGARIQDVLSGAQLEVRAKVVVNATGVWVEEVLRRAGASAPRHIVPSKGIHLLFPAARIPIEGALALATPEGREGFAVRRWDYVYVGTTDVRHEGPLDHPVADRAAFEDVLALAQAAFPAQGLTEGDVLATWAGVRPLIEEPGKATRDTSRHDEIWQTEPGLLTVAGGKLTTYRPMAHRILTEVGKVLGRSLPEDARTGEEPLPRGELGEDPAGWRRRMQEAFAGRDVPPAAAERLTWLYGSAAESLLAMDPAWLAPLAPGCPALRGEVRLAVEEEMAATLVDFMDRRAALLLFSADRGRGAAAPAAELMAGLLGWDPARTAAEVARYLERVEAHGVPA